MANGVEAGANVKLTLPDGSVRDYTAPVTGAAVAADIGPGLAKAALAARIDGEMWDLNREIPGDCNFSIVTAKDGDALELLRHDAAHVLAQAVQELFPGTQVTIGPAIDNGFYYDFARDEPFSTDDFEAIEKRMAEIVDQDLPIERQVWDRAEAIAHFKSIGEIYKAEIIRDLPEAEEITIYQQGDWKDLCRGPHLPSTGKLGKAFKMLKLAGAYWRGDSRNEMLQRMYGTAWADEKQLKSYLTMIEEAEKRDHRRLGREMDLFHSRKKPSVRCSGTRKAGPSTAPSRPICAVGWKTPAMWRSRRRSWWTVRCGRIPATGTSSARTCSSPRWTKARRCRQAKAMALPVTACPRTEATPPRNTWP